MHKEIVSQKDKDWGITLPDFKTHTYMEVWLMLSNNKWIEEVQKTVVNFLWMGEVKSVFSPFVVWQKLGHQTAWHWNTH